MGQQAIQMAPLYGQDLGAQKSAVQKSLGDKSIGDIAMQDYNGQPIGLTDFNSMSNRDFRKFKNSLSPEQSQKLFQSQAYIDNYNYFNPY